VRPPAARSGTALAPGISLTLLHLRRVPRGLFREAADTWQRLAQVPAGSTFDAGTGATRTPLAGPQLNAAVLRVSTELAPASIALTVLTHNGSHLGRTGPRGGGTAVPFCVPLGHAPGSPHPLGVSLSSAATRTGVPSPEAVLNFAVTSEAAQDMVLHLQWGTSDDGGELELALDRGSNRTGHTWHVALPAGGPHAVVPWAHGKVPGGLRFGWRAGGGGVCSLGRVCVDPYALVLTQPAFEPPCPPGMAPPPALGDVLADVALQTAPFTGDAATGPALGVRAHQATGAICHALTSHMPCPQRAPAAALVAAYLDVRRCTPAGTFAAAQAQVAALAASGVTAVVLYPPVTACLSHTPGTSPGDTPSSQLTEEDANSPLSLFAPDWRCGTPDDLLALVGACHSHGLRVMHTVQLAHTSDRVTSAAATGSGGCWSLAALDAPSYCDVIQCADAPPTGEPGSAVSLVPSPAAGPPRPAPNPPPPAALNPCAPGTQTLVVDAMRHWAATYRVDGFLLLGAAAANRGPRGRPPLLESIALDAVVGGPGALVFAHNLDGPASEVSLPHWGVLGDTIRQFPTDILAFCDGAGGQLSALATRLCGSGDVVGGSLRGPSFALNSVPPASQLASPAHARLAVLITMAAAGMPTLRAADLLSDPALGAFVKAAVDARTAHAALLARTQFPEDGAIGWFDNAMQRPKWEDPAAPALMAVAMPTAQPTLFLALNASKEDVDFQLPTPPPGKAWRVLLDAGAAPPADVKPRVRSFACSVFLSRSH
jgi:hypothetical protein